jgi:hypothetical protein
VDAMVGFVSACFVCLTCPSLINAHVFISSLFR